MNTQANNRSQINAKLQLFVMVALFFLITALNVWKARFGFCSTDESFYLTISHRLYLGDGLVIDEWHPSQFASVMVYPFFYLYMKVNGSTEGIILFFRLMYVLFNTITAVFLYYKTYKHGWISVICTAFYLLYTLGGMMTTNYNTIGLSCMIVSGLLFCFNDDHKFQWFLAGVFYAMAVLCTPTLALLYFAILAAVIIMKLRGGKDVNNRFHIFGWITIGIVMTAVIVCTFILSRASFSEIIHCFPYLFSSDDAHELSLFSSIKKTLYLFYMIFNETALSRIAVPVYAIVVSMALIDRNRKQHQHFYVLTSVICTLVLAFAFQEKISLALVPLAAVIYLVSDHSNASVFRLWLYGIVYCLLLNLSSDTIIYAVSMAAMLCAISSLIMLGEYCKNEATGYRSIGVLTTILAVVCVSLQCYYKINLTYGDAGISLLSEQILDGPASGVYTTEENLTLYNEMEEDINSLPIQSGEKVLLYTDRAWMYLMLDNCRYSTYSTWMITGREQNINILENYYETRAEKIPDLIYIPDNQIFCFFNIDIDSENYGYSITDTDYGILLTRK